MELNTAYFWYNIIILCKTQLKHNRLVKQNTWVICLNSNMHTNKMLLSEMLINQCQLTLLTRRKDTFVTIVKLFQFNSMLFRYIRSDKNIKY